MDEQKKKIIAMVEQIESDILVQRILDFVTINVNYFAATTENQSYQ